MSPQGQEIVKLGGPSEPGGNERGAGKLWSLNLNSPMKVAVGCLSHKADLCMTSHTFTSVLCLIHSVK